MPRRTEAEILAGLAQHHTHIQTTIGPTESKNSVGRPLWAFRCARDPEHGTFTQCLSEAHRLYNCPACSTKQKADAAKRAFQARAATYEAARRRQLAVIEKHLVLGADVVESLARNGFKPLKDVPCRQCGALLTCSVAQLKHIADEYKYGACPSCRATNPEYVENHRRGQEGRRSTFEDWQQKLNAHLGEGAVRLEPPGIGPDGIGVFTCLKDPQHGTFEKSLNSVLHYRRGCLACREASKNPHTSGYRTAFATGEARNAQGGWLYRITDASTELTYWGITKGTVQARFGSHRTSRKRTHPLYLAMRERPNDFSIEAIAFYFTDEDLARAENQAILEHRTRWPGGYNLDCGGTLNGKKQAWGKLTEAYIAKHPELTDDQKSLLRRGLQITAETLGVGLETLKRRLRRATPVAELFNSNCSVQLSGGRFPSVGSAIEQKLLPVSHYSRRRAELFKQGVPLRHKGGIRVHVHGTDYPSIAVASHVTGISEYRLRTALARSQPWISRLSVS